MITTGCCSGDEGDENQPTGGLWAVRIAIITQRLDGAASVVAGENAIFARNWAVAVA